MNSAKILISAQNIELSENGKLVSAKSAPVRSLSLINTFGNFSNNLNIAKEVAKKLNIKEEKEFEKLASNIVVYIDKGTWNLNVDAFADSRTEAYNIANIASDLIKNRIQSIMNKIQPGKETVVYNAIIVSPAQLNKSYKVKPRQFRTAVGAFFLVVLLATCFNVLAQIFNQGSQEEKYGKHGI